MKKLFCAFALLLTACSASGPTFNESKASLPAPQKGTSQLVIYRPDSYQLITRSPDVDINGLKACDLPNNSFFLRTVPAKQVMTLSASLWDMPGTSRLTLTPASGKRYYLRIAPDGGKLTAGVMGGALGGGLGAFAGSAVAEGMSSKAGPFAMDVLDENTASAELPTLKMNSGCK